MPDQPEGQNPYDDWRRGTPKPSPLGTPGLEDVQKQAQADQAKERQELAGPYGKLRQAEAQRPQTPNLQKIEGSPPDAKDFQKNSLEFASAMAVLGAISSRFTRQPGGAALGAFGAAVNGWQSGNLVQYEAATKEWQEKTKQTILNNRTVLEQYQLALENNQHNIDEQMSAIALTAVKYHDDIMYQAATAKNFTMVAQIYEKGVQNTGKLELSTEQLNKTLENEKAIKRLTYERIASGQIDPNGVDPSTGQPWTTAQQMTFKHIKEQGDLGAYNEKGKGGAGVSGVRMSPRNSIIQNLTEKLGRKPFEDEIEEQEAIRAGRIREETAIAGRAGNIATVVEEVHDTIPNVRALAQQNAGRGTAWWDSVENKWKVQAGDEGFANYVQQMNSLVNLYARLLSGGTGKGTVSDKDHARESLNPNMPLSAVMGSLKGFETETAIAEAAPDKARASIYARRGWATPKGESAPQTGGASGSWGSKSDDEIKKALENL
jgi:hypothetical protein